MGDARSDETHDWIGNDPALAAWAEANRREYARGAKALLEELQSLGYDVESAGALRDEYVRTKRRYTDAIPALLRALPEVTVAAVRVDIVRTLSMPWAGREAARALMREFEAEWEGETSSHRWAVANGLAVLAGDELFEDVRRLSLDTSYGSDREMLVVALGNMPDERAVDTAMQLIETEDTVGHAVMALRKLGDPPRWMPCDACVTTPRRGCGVRSNVALAAWNGASLRRTSRATASDTG